MTDTAATRLNAVLRRFDTLAIAVSGGIDSMVLAHMAHADRQGSVVMLHAVSAAVPASATDRVRAHAAAGWDLRLIDAGELDDPMYRDNPVNRCYFCKRNLYDTIAGIFGGVVASGNNVDDLGDFRPGLKAAEERRVVHPYVEAQIGKADIYGLARDLDLHDLHALPAQPCLSSRVETGIGVTRENLAFIERSEDLMHEIHGISATLRCRVTHNGVVVELEPDLLDGEAARRSSDVMERLCQTVGRPFLGIRPYRRGAAFLKSAAT